MTLKQLRICCTGSIGILAIPNLILTLRLAYQTEVRCYLTPSARRFITEHAFAAVSGISPSFDLAENEDGATFASVPLLVAPASADAIASLARGLGDHMAARLAMSATSPVIICPAMNEAMWRKPSIRRAMEIIDELGYTVVGPSPGVEIESLAPSESSMASIDTIIDALLTRLA